MIAATSLGSTDVGAIILSITQAEKYTEQRLERRCNRGRQQGDKRQCGDNHCIQWEEWAAQRRQNQDRQPCQWFLFAGPRSPRAAKTVAAKRISE